MPDEFEQQETQELENRQEVTDTETEVEEKRTVPLAEFEQLRARAKEAEEREGQTRREMMNLMGEFQKLANGQKNNAQDLMKKVDPEVLDALQPYLAPILNENEQIKSELRELKAVRHQVEAERFIESSIPNFEEVRPHLLKYIQSTYTEQEQREMTPREVARIGKWIADQQGYTKAGKSISRSSAKAETFSSANSRPSSDKDLDSRVSAWMEKNRDALR